MGSSSVTSLSVAGSTQVQNVTPASLLRSSSLQGAQGNGSPSGLVFSSLHSPRSSYNADLNGNLNSGGNATFTSFNASGNNSGLIALGSHAPTSNSGHSESPTVQRSMSVGTETLVFAGTGSMGFPASPLSFSSSNLNSTTGGKSLVVNSLNRHVSANRVDQQELQQIQQQTAGSNLQYAQDAQRLAHHQEQPQLSHLRTQQVLGVGTQQHVQGLVSVKLEQQLMSQQQGQPMQTSSVKVEPQMDSSLCQQLQQGLAPVKHEQMDMSLRQQLQHQQAQTLQGAGPMMRQHEQPLHQQLSIPKIEVKTDTDLSNPMIQQSLLTSHMQRQEALQLHRQQSQQFHSQMNLLQQQRILQQHRSQLQQQQQLQQHLRQQLAGPPKQLFEPGICARRLMQYMFNQRQRPQDNNINFWRRFVGEFFAHGAKKRWCVSQYGNNGRQPTGVFPQNVWHCEICGSRPGRGFETTVEVLPRLCKIKYDSGILDELLFVDISNEYHLNSGFMVLEYGKAIQESIFEQLRVVREGQLRIIFTPGFKIHLWEFCARGHEELLPRRLLVPQVTQLAAIAQKYQNSIAQNQNSATSLSSQDLQTNCQLFVGAARQLTRTLEAPTVNDLGYTKRYVRCLQISEVVNSMKDLIDFSRENRVGPIASLLNFPRRTGKSGVISGDALRQQDHATLLSEQNMGQTGVSITGVNNSSTLTGAVSSVGHNGNSVSSLPTLLHRNTINSLQSTIQMNGSSPPSIITSSNEPPFSSLTSSQRTYLSSLQNCNQSISGGGSGQPSPASTTFSQMARQNSLSSAVNLLQQSPGQFPQGNSQENSHVALQLQDLMMPSHLKTGQHGLTGTVNAKMTAGMVPTTEKITITANGYVCSDNINEALAGSECGGMGSAVSDSDSGNLGGVTSSFSDGLMNSNFLSTSNIISLGNNTDSSMVNGGIHSSSAIAEDQSFAIHDASQSFLNDFGSNDILGGLSNVGFSSLPFSWKSP